MKTSIYLDPQTARAYKWLQQLPGGFNLSLAISQVIVNTARERGWKEDEKEDQ